MSITMLSILTRLEKRLDLLGRLSPRQRQIYDLLVTGISNREAADRLGISYNTVTGHRTTIVERMGRENLPESFLKQARVVGPRKTPRAPYRQNAKAVAIREACDCGNPSCNGLLCDRVSP